MVYYIQTAPRRLIPQPFENEEAFLDAGFSD